MITMSKYILQLIVKLFYIMLVLSFTFTLFEERDKTKVLPHFVSAKWLCQNGVKWCC